MTGCPQCKVGPDDECSMDCLSRRVGPEEWRGAVAYWHEAHGTGWKPDAVFVCDGCTTPDDRQPDQRADRAACSRCGAWAYGYRIVA